MVSPSQSPKRRCRSTTCGRPSIETAPVRRFSFSERFRGATRNSCHSGPTRLAKRGPIWYICIVFAAAPLAVRPTDKQAENSDRFSGKYLTWSLNGVCRILLDEQGISSFPVGSDAVRKFQKSRQEREKCCTGVTSRRFLKHLTGPLAHRLRFQNTKTSRGGPRHCTGKQNPIFRAMCNRQQDMRWSTKATLASTAGAADLLCFLLRPSVRSVPRRPSRASAAAAPWDREQSRRQAIGPAKAGTANRRTARVRKSRK